MQFHEKLQKLRKDACMTQMELAEKLMVSRQAISKWETGNAIPDIENMVSICDLFHVSLDDLVRDTQTVKEEEKVSDDTDKKVWQENKKVTPKRRIIMVILLIAAVLLAGWQMNLFAITVIAIMWGILCVSLYWIIKKGLALLSKYVRKGEEIYQILTVINKRKREG